MKNNFNDTVVIILAGGKSSRAETVKGLRKLKNRNWIDHQINFFQNLGINHIFVGLAYHSERYLKESEYLIKESSSISYFINKYPENGPFSTLKTVLKGIIDLNWQRSVIIHIDHGIPLESTIASLIKEVDFDLVKPRFEGKSGHPIVLSKLFCKGLLLKNDHSTLAKEARNLPLKKIKWLEVNDENIHLNLNDKESWELYLNTIKF